jgi:YD repeat-containing protein
MYDSDMGVWTYEYDAVGNLIKQTDAKLQVLMFDYDALNRLTRKRTSTQTRATYLYDNLIKGNCIGRLSKITDLSGSTEFFYDNLGREIKSIKSVSGIAYGVLREYDALDRLTKLTYPDNSLREIGTAPPFPNTS